jgi:hypothetical protein
MSLNRDHVSSGDGSRVARAILQYLSLHPEAKDTQEGISTWWLQRQQIEQTLNELTKALDFLVARDFIVEFRGPDLRPYYKINQQQLEQIARFLGGSEA